MRLLLEPHLTDIELLEEVTGESFEEWKTYRDGRLVREPVGASEAALTRSADSVVTRSCAAVRAGQLEVEPGRPVGQAHRAGVAQGAVGVG